MPRELTAAQRRRRRKRAHDRELRQIGKDAATKLDAAQRKVADSERASEAAHDDQLVVEERMRDVTSAADTMQLQLSKLRDQYERQSEDLKLAQNTVQITNKRILQLEESEALMRAKLATSQAELDRKVRHQATQKVREMHPEWRKRMLAKTAQISDLNVQILALQNLRDANSEAQVQRNIKLRDDIIIALYAALKWCSSRPELQGGEAKDAWNKTIQPVMDKLENMIKPAKPNSEIPAQVPSQPLAVKDAEAST